MANTDVETLNSFLRGELSAVETYRQAIDHVSDDRIRSNLEDCLHDHEHRVETLRDRIEKLGGTPSEGSGLWGTFSKLVQGGAALMGEKAAVQALEQGEDLGLADYQRDMDKTHGEARRFVRMELLPAQKRTHERLSRLKRTLH
ncbi:demethoxyubiquinone hydroxylase family protein [Vitiosangium sp. GDMCC 1.1324]|uniref:demethoxyubiquinone hydroxylase family protein n=1 Tax=Vitiosangium sp. (strain GDMCC 1.1324) TaxID=2138576 RepID=UPI000D38811D|nr:demethoxyubiquinone hydroxylase family protein [Vitiosangium sp. GDMCC 1.1324]PTL80631.1 ferritin [Vitiosangium sp. GDMCC 1.1324]